MLVAWSAEERTRSSRAIRRPASWARAVQSHWFSVGSIVTWAAPGVGAVCTQSVAEPAYGPRLLAALRERRRRRRDALRALLAADGAARFRQVAVIAPSGPPAAHTGDGCIAYAGHVVGDDFSVQANMMASEEVWPAMAEAYAATSTGTPLARRLLAALRAAEGAGGDARGKQSAALVVVPASGEPWEKTVDLRVEDHRRAARRAGAAADAARRLRAGDARRRPDRRGPPRRGGRRLPRGRRAGARQPRAAVLGRPGGVRPRRSRARPGPGPRRRSRCSPGWRGLLSRLEPDVAPAAAARPRCART